MNREIIFRGKCSKTGEWFYGDLVRNEMGKFAIVPVFKINEHCEHSYYEVDPETIGQFSGLKDKNDYAIYEGDICLWEHDNLKYVVTFRDGMFYASIEELNKGICGGHALWILCQEEKGYRCEITGNIHDK